METNFVGKYLAKVNNKDVKAYFLKVVTILSMLTLIRADKRLSPNLVSNFEQIWEK